MADLMASHSKIRRHAAQTNMNEAMDKAVTSATILELTSQDHAEPRILQGQEAVPASAKPPRIGATC